MMHKIGQCREAATGAHRFQFGLVMMERRSVDVSHTETICFIEHFHFYWMNTNRC